MVLKRGFTIAATSLLILVLLSSWYSFEQNGTDNGPKDRVELGTPDWLRDHGKALERSKSSGKPIFILFTEVPGCSTVKGYGKRVLSDPLIADAIEEHFVPLAIFNNVKGKDRKVLRSYGEPTWNAPAVRIVDHTKEGVVPRLYGDYSGVATLSRMNKALRKEEGDLPFYLKLYERELKGRSRKKAIILNMACFWSGEAKLGRIEGVLNTRPGFMEGTEVVKLRYDPQRKGLKALLRAIHEKGAASGCFLRSKKRKEIAARFFGEEAHRSDESFKYAADDDDHALRGTAYEELSLTKLQRTRVNSSLAIGKDPKKFLFPFQKEVLKGGPDG
ncbi:MAG: VPGUxxT family thioredoxin-like (seleno)protein, type 2 [Flavobacteriales bacterium]